MLALLATYNLVLILTRHTLARAGLANRLCMYLLATRCAERGTACSRYTFDLFYTT